MPVLHMVASTVALPMVMKLPGNRSDHATVTAELSEIELNQIEDRYRQRGEKAQ